MELREITLLVEVGNHSFQLGEGRWFSPLASTLRESGIRARKDDHIAFTFSLVSVLAGFASFLSSSYTWAFGAKVFLLPFAVDNLHFLILLKLLWILP